MKRVTIVVKDEEGNFKEQVHFVEALKEAKSVTGFMAVVEQGRVKHPSPEVMCSVLTNEYNVNLADFYDKCHKLAVEKEPANADNDLNSDAIIPASNQPKNRQPKA